MRQPRSNLYFSPVQREPLPEMSGAQRHYSLKHGCVTQDPRWFGSIYFSYTRPAVELQKLPRNWSRLRLSFAEYHARSSFLNWPSTRMIPLTAPHLADYSLRILTSAASCSCIWLRPGSLPTD
jgi:hypothetical protein